MKFAPLFSSVAREPSGTGWPGRYLPVSTPCAIGDQTICDMPSSSLVGMTFLRSHATAPSTAAGSRPEVQVLGHQIDVGFEQAQHLAAMPQLVDSIDPASAEIQPGQTLFFFEPGLPRRVRQVPMILSRRLRLPFGRTGPFRYRQTGCGNCRLMVPPCHTSAMRFRPCLNS